MFSWPPMHLTISTVKESSSYIYIYIYIYILQIVLLVHGSDGSHSQSLSALWKRVQQKNLQVLSKRGKPPAMFFECLFINYK